ncbi:alpha/beta fold hydrolase [Sphaerisporangium rubeum]|uniref:Pimeloyl-ACP methyl ester carboxylesterase n=1 Tax=Sphaerisporangium rubeum TaxID=321317 RepID=A0A7X0IHA2_9ACTN|nr:pimeloyl-ACP methyl ester carboxylesterase [Sphaerisporangium rubeum]
MTGEKILRINGVDLCVETFGEAGDPAVLLVAGASSSMDWWEPEFCARLAAGGRFVIRYDHRDTGRSVTYPAGKPGYSGDDLVEDAVGVLDALGVARAHVVGISMGGGIGQVMGLDHGERVASLTLMSTSPGPGDADLPGVTEAMRAAFGEAAAEPDWTDREAVVEYVVNGCRPYAAASRPFDEDGVREIVTRVVERSVNIEAAMKNHYLIDGGEGTRARLSQIAAPTLVLHGVEDPLFPPAHGRALAGEIPDARLLPLEGVGHESPRAAWDVVIPAILWHTSGGWGRQADLLATKALADDDPTGWFERLYAAADAGEVPMPWDREGPREPLREWAETGAVSGGGRRAVVIGCGLGADAEYVAGLGFDTDAFDISATAVRTAQRRHPGSAVRYRTADLFRLPAEWIGAFDLVVEIFTVQALPVSMRGDTIAAVRGLVGPGGTLIVVMAAREDDEEIVDGPPWPLTRAEMVSFAEDGLSLVRLEKLESRLWRAEYRRG